MLERLDQIILEWLGRMERMDDGRLTMGSGRGINLPERLRFSGE